MMELFLSHKKRLHNPELLSHKYSVQRAMKQKSPPKNISLSDISRADSSGFISLSLEISTSDISASIPIVKETPLLIFLKVPLYATQIKFLCCVGLDAEKWDIYIIW